MAMKALLVCATLVVAVSAQFDIGGLRSNGNGNGNGATRPVYGPPQKEFEAQPETPQQNGEQQADSFQPTTYRHVFVHSAPDEPVDEQARIIRVPGGDKHVNIIFVKTPSQSSSAQTEVILPEQDEHKNLVYVLLKKNEAENNIKIRRPQAKRPTSPEVYFIRYKDQEEEQQGGYQQGPSNGNGHGNGHANGNGHGNGHANGNGHGNGHANGNGNGGYQQRPSNGNGNGNGHSAFPIAPSPPRQNGNGNGSPYSDAGRYTPSVAPGPIRSPADVPSSGYGVPL